MTCNFENFVTFTLEKRLIILILLSFYTIIIYITKINVIA